MSNIGYKSQDEETNKLIARLQDILSNLEARIQKLEEAG